MSTLTLTQANGTYEGKTAAEWKAEARKCYASSAASFERCQEDGWVSQKANEICAREYELKAELADNGAVTEVEGVFDLDGNLLKTELRFGDYGHYYLVGEGRSRDLFSPSQARSEAVQARNNAKKGYRLGTVQVPAIVKMVSGGTGMAGAMSSWAQICPASKTVDPATAKVISVI